MNNINQRNVSVLVILTIFSPLTAGCMLFSQLTPEQTLLIVGLVLIQAFLSTCSWLLFRNQRVLSIGYLTWCLVMMLYSISWVSYLLVLMLDDIFSNYFIIYMLGGIPIIFIGISTFLLRINNQFSNFDMTLKTGRFRLGSFDIDFSCKDQEIQMIDGKSIDIYTNYVDKIDKKKILIIIFILFNIFSLYSIVPIYSFIHYFIYYLVIEFFLLALAFYCFGIYLVELYYSLKSGLNTARS